MNDVDDFFAEQDRRMSIPNEDVDEYIQTRLGKNQYVIRLMKAGLALHSPGSNRRSTQGRVSGSEDIGIPRQ
jgi:hypothetical protein